MNMRPFVSSFCSSYGIKLHLIVRLLFWSSLECGHFFDAIKLHLMVRLLFWSSVECGHLFDPITLTHSEVLVIVPFLFFLIFYDYLFYTRFIYLYSYFTHIMSIYHINSWKYLFLNLYWTNIIKTLLWFYKYELEKQRNFTACIFLSIHLNYVIFLLFWIETIIECDKNVASWKAWLSPLN